MLLLEPTYVKVSQSTDAWNMLHCRLQTIYLPTEKASRRTPCASDSGRVVDVNFDTDSAPRVTHNKAIHRTLLSCMGLDADLDRGAESITIENTWR